MRTVYLTAAECADIPPIEREEDAASYQISKRLFKKLPRNRSYIGPPRPHNGGWAMDYEESK